MEHFYDRVFLPAVIPVCIIGILSSVLYIGLLVLGRCKSNSDTTRFIFQMLAVVDAMYLFLSTFNFIMSLAKFRHVIFHSFYLLFWPMYNLAAMAMDWLVFLVTLDRYSIVYRPQFAILYGTPRRLKMAVRCLVGVACIQLPVVLREHNLSQ